VIQGELACRLGGPDPFLRGGAPAAEALLLLAIMRHDLDIVLPDLSGGRIVLEGRSVDTTACARPFSCGPGAPAAALDEAVSLVGLAASFRPLPDLTILITDDPSAAIERAQRRDSRCFTPDQVAFMNETFALHEQLAATDPVRYRVVDRRSTDSHEAVRQIRTWILQARHGLRCAREPWQSQGACSRPQ
jgi:dTMP kinase